MVLKIGAVIGQAVCPICGAQVDVKLNKNLTVYACCRSPIVSGGFEKCLYRVTLGRMASQEIRHALDRRDPVTFNFSFFDGALNDTRKRAAEPAAADTTASAAPGSIAGDGDDFAPVQL